VGGMTSFEPQPRFLMCRPTHFAVTYAINPWMDPAQWARNDHALGAASWREWTLLHDALDELGASIELVPPVPGLPDLVFTANAAVVLDGTALLARFRHPERQCEEPQFEAAFRLLQAQGILGEVRAMPGELVLEGAGDCVWDRARSLFWMGFGPRSDFAARDVLEETFGIEVVPLELVDARFYHLDTALSALPNGELVYFPEALSRAAREIVEARVGVADRIALTAEEACGLSANAVVLDGTVLTPSCSPRLRRELEHRGYCVREIPLGSFLRSGGAAFCLTLRLDIRSERQSRAIARRHEQLVEAQSAS
jgi:N-dimethylarginine dimethylaminohydrolase